jgi:radical SAM protein with 4Fe4S-binding SPASM domain
VGESFGRRRHRPFEHFQQCLARLLDAGIATVLQVTLSAESLGELDDIVRLCQQHPQLYGVIFLAYKEVGRGAHYHHVLAARPAAEVHRALRAAFAALGDRIRVGYDCCLTPALVGIEPEWTFNEGGELEGCSALRSSIGVLPSLDVVPCTFLPGASVGNLRRQSLRTIWQGAAAERFRAGMARHLGEGVGCAECASRAACLGGCPAFALVGCLPAAQATGAVAMASTRR